MPLDADQLQQLLRAAGRRPRRPENYSSADPLEWITWRRNASRIITLNGWDDGDNLARAKNEIRVSITGNADVVVADIQPLGAAETLEEFLDRLQARFCPAAQSQYARMAYDQATQNPSEDILGWHGRLRALFTRAHPGLAADLENNNILIRKFVVGLIDADVKQWTLSADPATYAVALTVSQNRAAVGAVLSGGKASSVSSINAVDDGSGTPSTAGINTTLRRNGITQQTGTNAAPAVGGGGLCWRCGSPNHLMRDCPRVPANGGARGGRGRGGRGRGFGGGRGAGRGRGRGGRPSGGRGGRSLNSMGEGGGEGQEGAAGGRDGGVNSLEEQEYDEGYIDAISAAAQRVESALDGGGYE